MSIYPIARRQFISLLVAAPFLGSAWIAEAAASEEALITKLGAKADGATLNTKAIQSAIDHLASRRGGTVVVPQGTFVSGALFFKPKVNLRLLAGAVLQCSTNVAVDFPAQRTRIEGHFLDHFNPALINAKNCDGFQLTGEGTLDGAGMPVWEAFWKGRAADRNFANTGMPRARLALIEGSRNVTIDGVTFKDSQFWNLHLYNNDGVTVRNTHFQVPDDYRQAPSTDGIDVDSSRNVTIDGCFFSVTDDCIALKGSKGPHADEDKDSPAVENIHVRNCTYKRGGGVPDLWQRSDRRSQCHRRRLQNRRPGPHRHPEATPRHTAALRKHHLPEYRVQRQRRPPHLRRSLAAILRFAGRSAAALHRAQHQLHRHQGHLQRLRQHPPKPRPNGDQRHSLQGSRRCAEAG